jgi:hypothetical protein
MLKKKIWVSFQRIIDLLPKNLSLSSQKYGFGIRDPEKNLYRIPNPGPGVKRHRIRNTKSHTRGIYTV